MAQETNTPSAWQRIKDAWPIITFSIAIAVGLASGYFDMRMALAENSAASDTNKSAIASLTEAVTNRATKFLTDQEFQRLWNDVLKQANSLEELEDQIQSLGLNDERVNAKIELEIEKLRNEIKEAARDQQRALQEQTTVMQQILIEVQKE